MPDPQQLAEYRFQLSMFDPSDADAFARLLRVGMELLDLRPVDLCEQFAVSVPTVRRWREGVSAPIPAARQLVVNHLIERTTANAARVPSSPMHAIAGP